MSSKNTKGGLIGSQTQLNLSLQVELRFAPKCTRCRNCAQQTIGAERSSFANSKQNIFIYIIYNIFIICIEQNSVLRLLSGFQCMQRYVCAYIHVNMRIYTYPYVHVYMDTYIYRYVYLYMCIYIYTHKSVLFMYIHIYFT